MRSGVSGSRTRRHGLIALAAVTLLFGSPLGPSPSWVAMASSDGVQVDRAALSNDTARSQVPRVRPLVFSTSQSRFTRFSDNQGWWSTRYGNDAANDNYVVGESDEPGVVYRNFFTFDLSRLGGRVEAARLVLRRYRGGGEATETLGLYAVATAAPRLNHNEGPNRAIFRDLGTGQSYGRFAVATRSPNPYVYLSLNHAAVADINAARGRFFSIGGSLLTAGGDCPFEGNCDKLFRYSQGRGMQQLVVLLREPSIR